jgi:membrane protease YdiL (CAAX protease family)
MTSPRQRGESAPVISRIPEDLRLAVVTLVWLALAHWLDRLGAAVIPDAWKRHIEFQTFLMLCQVTTAAAGLGLSFALLGRPVAAAVLTLRPPRARDVAAAALLAPALFVGSAVAALLAARPMLLAEASARGPHVSREHAGAFGRALTASPLLPTLLWSVVLAALTEELLFRGALFSLLERLASKLGGPRPPHLGQPSTSARFVSGLVATVGAAVVFALLHWDLEGGVGLVRVLSTLGLGLACGAARQITGTVAAPVALHLAHNAVAVGYARRWFASDAPLLFDALPFPDPLLALAAAGLVACGALLWVSALLRRRAEQVRALRLDA